ncbi:thioredoxin family protein [Halalkalibaculum sp. DA3122]|uniref:thioredoxin family protein n=1 Tax=unclassified Halalkalibaculum TaxID=2964617 RepID=UPI003754FD77
MKQTSMLLAVLFFMTVSAFQGVDRTAKINWYSLEEAQELAKSGDKKVMIYMEASWCGYCKKMEREVFPQKAVQDSLHKYYYPVRLDVESKDRVTYNGTEMSEREFAGSIRVSGTPTFLFINGQGEILGKQPGFIPVDTFKSLLAYVGSDAYARVKFDQYIKNRSEE